MKKIFAITVLILFALTFAMVELNHDPGRQIASQPEQDNEIDRIIETKRDRR